MTNPDNLTDDDREAYDAECYDGRCDSTATKVLFTEDGDTVPGCDTHGENWPDDKTLSLQDDTDDYEEQWDQIDEKVLLAQILTELQQIRCALSDGARDAPAMYECTLCPGEQRVPAGDRERHAMHEHKASPEMSDGMFEEVGE